MTAQVPILVLAMLVSGSANSLLTKWQDMQCVKHCAPNDPRRVNFEQPVWQSLNMFIGEMMCLVAHYAYSHYSTRKTSSAYEPIAQHDDQDEERSDIDPVESHSTIQPLAPLTLSASLLFILPTLCDLTGTTLMNVGLIYTPVSIYQMTRGLLVLWVGILSVMFLKRRLEAYQWVCLVLVTAGVALVGLAGSLVKRAVDPTDVESSLVLRGLVQVATAVGGQDDPTRVLVGVLFIACAQIFTAAQFVIEEKILSHYAVKPLQAVGLEGLFGVLAILIALPFLHLFLASTSPYFDVPTGWNEITTHPRIMGISVAICVSIAVFNLSGLSLTKAVSAAARSTIDTCRTLTIWMVSLALGWEILVWPISLLQVAGFALLVYGTFVFNGLVKPILLAPRVSTSVQLPHEDRLEATGELPSSAADGRVGFDVIPTRRASQEGA